MTLDELIELVENTNKLPDFYGLKQEIKKHLTEYKKIKGE